MSRRAVVVALYACALIGCLVELGLWVGLAVTALGWLVLTVVVELAADLIPMGRARQARSEFLQAWVDRGGRAPANGDPESLAFEVCF
jgi:hypothetical protein